MTKEEAAFGVLQNFCTDQILNTNYKARDLVEDLDAAYTSGAAGRTIADLAIAMLDQQFEAIVAEDPGAVRVPEWYPDVTPEEWDEALRALDWSRDTFEQRRRQS